MTTHWDIVNKISYKKNLKIDENDVKEKYNPWFVNRFFSKFPDTLWHANNMNMNIFLDKDMQFCYYLNSVRARRRFKKWKRKEVDNNDVNSVMKYFKVSRHTALDYLKFLDEKELEKIKEVTENAG